METKVKATGFLLFVVFAITSLPIAASQTTLEAVSLLPSSQRQYRVEVAFPSLSFNAPVGIYNARDGSNRLFVVDRRGLIRVFNNSRDASAANVFLDISDRVFYGGEQGLLGLAFHANFGDNGYFYVDYVANNPRRTIVARYSLKVGNPDEDDPAGKMLPLLLTGITDARFFSRWGIQTLWFSPDATATRL